MLNLGWFSTGRGEGSMALLEAVHQAIQDGSLGARIEFVFTNRQLGEAGGSDRFINRIKRYDLPLISLSSSIFRRSHGGGTFEKHRLAFDREVMSLLEQYTPDICVLAGYMLIAGPEMSRRYTMINLHPALPDGPVGTWQDVIWQLIEDRSQVAGAHIHLATDDLDRGPVLTHYSFPINGPEMYPYWNQVSNRSIEDIKSDEGEALPLFKFIREEGVKREHMLVVATLQALARGDIRVRGAEAKDSQGRPISGFSLNQAIENTLSNPPT